MQLGQSTTGLIAANARVAIITALEKEFVAMKAVLDDPTPLSTMGNAPGEYVLGTVPSREGRLHTVVLARCDVGENLSAANTAILLERLPGIETVIMAGIAGAVPSPDDEEADVRLGDIVVSSAQGVIQYDHDKEVMRNGKIVSEPRHPPRPPSARLVQASRDLAALEMEGQRPWEEHITRGRDLPAAARPTDPDTLHAIDPPHELIARENRENPTPRVFRGPIASGNKLLKNAELRERLRTTFGVRAVEMEASGVADATWLNGAGYFVVRGTCDYCDQFKNDVWQGYAAVIAAAYTRALLAQVPSQLGPTQSLPALDTLPH